MYEKHFGLKSRLFGANAEGKGVFVGPQQNKNLISIQKGLSAPDAVVTVTGPVGVGKTTMVNRALETLPTGRTAAQIGRMHLSQQEVIDLLMAGFGIKQKLNGSIRRFAAFRRLLQKQSEKGIPVAIVIEDAQRLGADALAEVEALTAADAGDKASANIILMGQPGLSEFLSTPDLARLKQRIRLRQSVDALTLAEVRGYLKHCVREAGGDYDAIFDDGVAEIAYGCSEGIPRVINTLFESALTTAMEESASRVSTKLMSQVAFDAFGYEADAASSVTSPPAASVAAVASIEPLADPDIDWEAPPALSAETGGEVSATDNGELEFGHDIIVESGCYPASVEEESPQPVEATPQIDPAIENPVDDEDDYSTIPELINDTQPELPRLSPPVEEDFADIPVLVVETDIADADSSDDESDIESTQTLVQPVGLTIDEAVTKAPLMESASTDGNSQDETAEKDFDLDAALSPEVESTNMMLAITPNIDALANEPQEPTIIQEVLEPIPEARPELELEATAGHLPVDDEPPGLPAESPVDTKNDVAQVKNTKVEEPPQPEPTPVDVEAPVAPTMQEPSGKPVFADHNADIDALEAALAAAKNGAMAPQTAASAKGGGNGLAAPLKTEEVPAVVPEITLDKAIEDQRPKTYDLDQFRAEIGSANSLEEISDKMAETLFGCEEFAQIAADVVANPPGEPESGANESKPSPVKLAEDEMPGAANDESDLKNAPEPPKAVRAKTPAPAASESPMDSTALRINMLNAMKSNAAAAAENIELGQDDRRNAGRKPKGPRPEPIEQQINTSITQTLQALSLSKMPESNEADSQEKKATGLFSRFKKSS